MKKFYRKHHFLLFVISLSFNFIAFHYIGVIDIWKNISSNDSITLSILCSIIASCIMLIIPIPSDSTRIKRTVKETLKNLPDERFPAVYDDTNDPNKKFNDRLNEGIKSTQKYIYFSDRALYLTQRLGREIDKHDPRLEIYVFLADITDDSIFRSREHMYLQRERASVKCKESLRSINEIINNEKMEILRSLYALGKLDKKYDIHVYLHKEIPFIRFEITDSLIILTLLNQWASGKKYPATFMYENNDLLKLNLTDYTEQLRMRSRELTLGDLTVDKLKDLAKTAGLPDFSDDEITKHYEEKVKRGCKIFNCKKYETL